MRHAATPIAKLHHHFITSFFSTQAPAPPPSLSSVLLLASFSLPHHHPLPSSLPPSLPPFLLLPILRRPSTPLPTKLHLLRLFPSLFSPLLLSLSPSCPDLLPLLRLALLTPDHPLPSSTLNSLLRSLFRSGLFDSALQALDLIHSLSPSSTSLLTPLTYSSFILALLHHSHLSHALSIFNTLLSTSVLPSSPASNALLAALFRSGSKSNFYHVFDELRQRGFHFDAYTFNICIHAFGSWGRLGLALRLFKEMRMAEVAPDTCTYNSVIRSLCLAGRVRDGLVVYEEMKGSGHEPDRFTYRALILGCCKAYQLDEALRVFREMEYNNAQVDTIVYNNLIDGLLKVRRLDDACHLFEKMVSEGVRASCYSHNILIDGLFKNGRPAAGMMLFNELKKKKGSFVDGITYGIVISYLCREGRTGKALELIEEMEGRGLVVDLVMITSVLIGLHKNGQSDSAERLMKHVRDHALLPGVLSWKANMEAYLKGPQDKSKDFTPMFPSVGDFGDIMSWIKASKEDVNGDDDHFSRESKDDWSSSPYLDRLAEKSELIDDSSIFTVNRGNRVQENGIKSFDIDMVNTYLSIFLSKGKLSIACKLFEIFTSLGKEPVSYTYNSLMSSFVKKGYLKEAWGVLQEMGEKLCPADIATYNLVIQGLGKMGMAEVASRVLDQLLKKGGHLDIVMYNTLMNALGKAGRINEVNKLFKQMTESGINADVVTFNTLIEVHAKAGRIKEAYKFLRKMLGAGCPPNHVTDTTLAFLEKEIVKLRKQEASERLRKDDSVNDPVC